jgi:hypothetical protein
MGTLILQTQHLSGQLTCGQGSGVMLLEFLADLVILAKYAGKVAAGKKNGPGTFCP